MQLTQGVRHRQAVTQDKGGGINRHSENLINTKCQSKTVQLRVATVWAWAGLTWTWTGRAQRQKRCGRRRQRGPCCLWKGKLLCVQIKMETCREVEKFGRYENEGETVGMQTYIVQVTSPPPSHSGIRPGWQRAPKYHVTGQPQNLH